MQEQVCEVQQKSTPSENEETERTESEISEEEDTMIKDISFLLEHSVCKEDITKLKHAGINTIKGLQMTMKRKLHDLGFETTKIEKLRNAASKISMNTGFMTALEVSDQRKQIFKLSTGSKNLDNLLGGGIEAMAITEVFGEFRTGKTQLAHTLCVTAQMPGVRGYTGGKVIFIDTEHTFRPDRLSSIAERFNLDSSRVLENVLYARAYNSEHQFELLNDVAAKLHEEAGIFKLLILDSIMALFRVDFCGRGEMADRQMRLGQMLSKLQKISEEFNIAVFITNQITSDFSAAQSLSNSVLNIPNISSASKPSGGNILAHASTTRICFKKGEGCLRQAILFDSPDLEENEAMFILTVGGVDDPDE